MQILAGPLCLIEIAHRIVVQRFPEAPGNGRRNLPYGSLDSLALHSAHLTALRFGDVGIVREDVCLSIGHLEFPDHWVSIYVI